MAAYRDANHVEEVVESAGLMKLADAAEYFASRVVHAYGRDCVPVATTEQGVVYVTINQT